MKFKKVVARFDAPDIGIAEELICDIFFAFNLKGVVCDVPLDEPDEGFGTSTLPLPEYNSITGFLPLLDSTDLQIKKIKSDAGRLADLGIKIDILTQIVDEQDWADAWKAYFEVTPITDRIIIKPEWKPYEPRKGELVIHLDPGMAFGTGTHPTTAMCLRLMDKYLTPNARFLDVGTGSGILMIAAALLNACRMTGIDTDPVAIGVAKQNLEKNKIAPDIYDLACTTLDQIRDKTCDPRYDFIAANIIAQVIVDIIPGIRLKMTDQAVSFLSGIIQERLEDVMAAIESNNLCVIEKMAEDGWVALAVKKI